MRKSLNIKIQISKNVTIFENQINWKEPITLTEGVFDDGKKKFFIPLLGKFIPKTLMDSIYKNGVKKISILLDKDLQDQAFVLCELLYEQWNYSYKYFTN